MKRAVLGFRYLGLEHELKVPEAADLLLASERRKREVHTKEKQRKLRNYHNHKDQYNQQKRSVARSIAGRYEEAKRKAGKEGIPWSFAQDAWEQAWQDAGYVSIPGSQDAENPEGVAVPAFALRGPHRYNNTCMVRRDYSQGWSMENAKIVFRGEELKPGSRWYRTAP